MKHYFILLLGILIFFSCKEESIKEPERIIDEETMITIFYDLSLLEAIKSNNPIALESNGINPYTYIYKKYKIDSLQFAQNNAYYASDLKKYKKMYEEVEKRIEVNKKIADSLLKKTQKEATDIKAVDLKSVQKDSTEIRKMRENKELKKKGN